jgi:hypothetical protein
MRFTPRGEAQLRYVSYAWRIVVGVIYLAVVIGILSGTATRFETLVLAAMVQLYTAVLYNFSLIGVATDVNNYAGFVRFRILAAALGVTENEDGQFQEQEEALAERLKKDSVQIQIQRFFNAAVSLYALFKIVQVIILLGGGWPTLSNTLFEVATSLSVIL